MKLTIDNRCYLQKFDLIFILQESVIIPPSFKKECEKWSSNLKVRNTRDNFTFVGPFVDPVSIQWIEDLGYIIDYDNYASSPIKALNKRIRSQTREARLYEESVRTMRRELVSNRIEEHLRATKRQAKKAQQKLAALEILRDHLEHKIEFEFPEGYIPPTPPEPKRSRLFNRILGHYRIP